MSHYCEKCGKTLQDTEFYTSKNIEKYPPDGKMNICKKCLTMHVDNWDPETYKWILQEIDVPYIKEKWDGILEKYGKDGKKITGLTIIGRYLSQMKLKQWSKFRWEDTEKLEEEYKQEKISAMKAQGLSDEDIQQELSRDFTPPKPKDIMTSQFAVGQPTFYDPELEEDEFSDQLTDEDKMMLRLKWGRGYQPAEWVRLEQLYNDFTNSYDIQTAGHKDTLIMVCKASLKANLLLDAGDTDGARKMTQIYNDLMKSGNFTAVQNKGEGGNFIDSIGELVTLCEREGFIPRYYITEPKDMVDKTIMDLQHYTKKLVVEEMNLGNMIESSVREIEKDRERESTIDIEDQDEAYEDKIFQYQEDKIITDDDYEEYFDSQEQARQSDVDYVASLIEQR